MREIEETIVDSVQQGLQEAKRLQEIKSKKKESEIEMQLKKKPRVMWGDDDISEPTSTTQDITETNVTTTTSSNDELDDNSPSEETANSTNSKDQEKKDIEEVEEKDTVEDVKEDKDSFDLNTFNSAQELEALGLEKLKEELQQRGMKMGGTLKERAERLFAVKGKSVTEIDLSLRATTKEKKRKRKENPTVIKL